MNRNECDIVLFIFALASCYFCCCCCCSFFTFALQLQWNSISRSRVFRVAFFIWSIACRQFFSHILYQLFLLWLLLFFFRQFVFFFTVIVVIAPSHGILIENYLLPFGFLNLQNLLPFRIARHFHHFRCCCCFSWLSSIRYNYAVHLSGSFNFQCRAASWLCLSLRSLSCFQHLIAVLDSRTRSQC